MYLLGYDIGSSSVKASLVHAETGKCEASAFSPAQEMPITAHKPGWAEQDPSLWWENLKIATQMVMKSKPAAEVKAIGISYQMHGLVMIDRNAMVLRPSIIWCDSRAVPFGEKAFRNIGEENCLSHILNSPGNFTASKLAWVKENEPGIFNKAWKIMLPGDYIALKMTGEAVSTITGMSEGMFWDFKENKPASMVLSEYGFDKELLPSLVPVFSQQGYLLSDIAQELGLPKGIPVAYRAGDQPNNAFSLNVLEPGEVATTAGTSGVVYGVSSEIRYDKKSRVNSFAHVNHQESNTRLGVLLCINGTGILYSWIKRQIGSQLSYPELNKLAEETNPGSDGLRILPFGNGAERMLENKDPACSFHKLNFNIHSAGHMVRAAQEGIAFSFQYGMEIMKTLGIQPEVIRAGNANMFLSPVFRETLSALSGARIELYDTDGSVGAAKGAGIGAGIYRDAGEAFRNLVKLSETEPDSKLKEELGDAWQEWNELLKKQINQ